MDAILLAALAVGGLYLFSKSQEKRVIPNLKIKPLPSTIAPQTGGPAQSAGETVSGGPGAPEASGTAGQLIDGYGSSYTESTPAAPAVIDDWTSPYIDPDTLNLSEPETGTIKASVDDFAIPEGLPEYEKTNLRNYISQWVAAGMSPEAIQTQINNYMYVRSGSGSLSAEAAVLAQTNPQAAMDLYWQDVQARVYPVAVAYIPGEWSIDMANRRLFWGDSVPANAKWVTEWQPRTPELPVRTWYMDQLDPTSLGEMRQIGLNIEMVA